MLISFQKSINSLYPQVFSEIWRLSPGHPSVFQDFAKMMAASVFLLFCDGHPGVRREVHSRFNRPASVNLPVVFRKNEKQGVFDENHVVFVENVLHLGRVWDDFRHDVPDGKGQAMIAAAVRMGERAWGIGRVVFQVAQAARETLKGFSGNINPGLPQGLGNSDKQFAQLLGVEVSHPREALYDATKNTSGMIAGISVWGGAQVTIACMEIATIVAGHTAALAKQQGASASLHDVAASLNTNRNQWAESAAAAAVAFIYSLLERFDQRRANPDHLEEAIRQNLFDNDDRAAG